MFWLPDLRCFLAASDPENSLCARSRSLRAHRRLIDVAKEATKPLLAFRFPKLSTLYLPFAPETEGPLILSVTHLSVTQLLLPLFPFFVLTYISPHHLLASQPNSVHDDILLWNTSYKDQTILPSKSSQETILRSVYDYLNPRCRISHGPMTVLNVVVTNQRSNNAHAPP